MRSVIIGLLWLIGLVGACATVPVVPAPVNAPPSTCADACEHVDTTLGCQNGGACMAVCQRANDPVFAGCMFAATSCPAVDACGAQSP